MSDDWIDVGEAARIVGVSVEGLRHSGADSVVRKQAAPGGRVAWNRADLERVAVVRRSVPCSMAVAVRVVGWLDRLSLEGWSKLDRSSAGGLR